MSELIHSSFVRRDGDSDRHLSREAGAGELARIRRGSYALAASWNAATPEKQHLWRVVAAAHAARKSPVFSHHSAALAWGLPVVDGLPSRPQITVPPGSGLRSNRVVVRHEARVHPAEVAEAAGVRVTDIPRTVVDLAAASTFLGGTCAAEAALASGDVTREQLLSALDRRRPLRGSKKVEAVLEFAGAFSGSPIESLCRVRFRELGIPQPEQQRGYTISRGRRYFVDFYWPEFDVICEADGKVKYDDPTHLNGRSPEQVVWEEKLREDDLRSLSRGFVRLTWSDAWNRAGLITKLARVGIHRSQ